MKDLALTEPAAMDSLVGKVADDFIARLDAGEAPNIEEYVERHTDIALILRQILPALQVMRSRVSSGDSLSVPTINGTADSGDSELGQLGDYRILREVGRGGMGIVYEAEQVSLGRRVALKVLPFAAAVEPKQLQRFKQEAQAAAHLVHQNIVAVYAVGCERGVHYYAMQFIEGQSLATLVAELRQRRDSATAKQEPNVDAGSTAVARISTEHSRGSPNFFRSVAQLGIQAAEALEHAHQQGVLHRDVKPANLLVDSRGHLWVTDFGLARFHREASLTQTGDIVGTLRYISPEQAHGPQALVDQRTDVYGIGATLYELVALRPVHNGQNRQELLRQIDREEPTALRQHNHAIPTEVATIIHKALAHDAADRYATAQELADDLRRYLEDKPIQAKRPTLAKRLSKWTRRHQGVVKAAAFLLVFAVAALTIATVVIWREKEFAKQAHGKAEVERRRADVRYRLARLAPDDIYTDVIQNWLAETEVMRKWLTAEAHRNVETELLNKALAYYQAQSAATAHNPDMRLEAAIAQRRIGEVLQKLDRPEEARPAFVRALSIFEGLTAEFAEVPDYGLNLITCQIQLAGLLASDRKRFSEAEESYQQALTLSQQLAERFPDLIDVHTAEADAAVGLGGLLRTTRRFMEAEQKLGNAIDLLRTLIAGFPKHSDSHSRLARALHGLARLRIDQQNLGEAAKLLQEALRHQETALASNRNYPDYRQALTDHFQALFPLLFQLRKHEEAAEGAELFARLLPERGCDVSAAVQVLNVCISLVERETDRPEMERNVIRDRYISRARELHQEAVRRSEGDPDMQNLLAWQFAMLPQDWIHDPSKGVALAQKAVAQKPTEPTFWTTLGIARFRAGESSEAVEALTEAVRLGKGGAARDWLYLALAHRRLGNHIDARRWYERAAGSKQNDAPGDWEMKNLRAEAAALFGADLKSR